MCARLPLPIQSACAAPTPELLLKGPRLSLTTLAQPQTNEAGEQCWEESQTLMGQRQQTKLYFVAKSDTQRSRRKVELSFRPLWFLSWLPRGCLPLMKVTDHLCSICEMLWQCSGCQLLCQRLEQSPQHKLSRHKGGHYPEVTLKMLSYLEISRHRENTITPSMKGSDTAFFIIGF